MTNYNNRIAHLTEMHRILDKQVTDLEKSKNFDDQRLHELKKKKLAFKDEISRLVKLQWEETHERVNLDEDR